MDNKRFKLKLKLIWYKNFLGLAIDQVNSIQQYSLTPYYFWPKTDAFEQLKLELDSKLWLTQEEKVATLSMARSLMEYWLSNRKLKSDTILRKSFSEVELFSFTN